MGQIFHACAYDIDTKTCCVIDADKFHANCYSHCGTVFSIHYLLRQKPYRVMWLGGYVTLDDMITNFTREEDLLGLSTHFGYEDFEYNNKNLSEKSYIEQIKFIDQNHKLWNEINVWEDAKKYFDWENTHSVKYTGYLVNHTRKVAVDLADYHNCSKYLSDDGSVFMAIDAIPALTETGGGTPMALFKGMDTNTTEELVGTWCGDLLQIVEELPQDFTVIPCCFAEISTRLSDCYKTFGVDAHNCILCNQQGDKFTGAILNMRGKRGEPFYVTATTEEKGVRFESVFISEYENYLKDFAEGRTARKEIEEPPEVKKIKTAKKFIAMGFSSGHVASMTKLSVEEVEKLRQE